MRGVFIILIGMLLGSRGYACEFRRVFKDFGRMNLEIFSADTARVLAATIPFYSMGRVLDKPIHQNFYCATHHKNLRQFPRALYYAVDVALGAMMFGFASLSIFEQENSCLRRTAQLYTLTLPYTWLVKNLLKQMQHEGCERPKNEYFCRSKKYYGGCPSGHMLEVAYTATLFGSMMGPSWSLPIWMGAGFLAFEYINCNRHFLSQLIAGAGLGIIFGRASARSLAAPDPCLKFSVEHENGGTGLRATYHF